MMSVWNKVKLWWKFGRLLNSGVRIKCWGWDCNCWSRIYI